MKRNLLFNQLTAIGKRLAMVLTMLLIVGIGQVWGEEVTINANQITGFGSGSNYTSSSITIDDITIASNSGFSTTQFRVAKSKNLVISCAGKMTKIVFTVSNTSYKLNATGITWNNTSGTYTNASGIESVTFTNSDANIARITKIVITYTPSSSGGDPDPCTTPTVTWNTKPSNGEVGGSMTASVTTNYSNGLTYSSSNQTVATVTNAGVINYLATGTTTITATVTGDGTTICEGPVSVQQEITVTAPAGGGGSDDCDNPTWQLVTNVSDLAVGDEIVIAASTANYALSTTQRSSNRQAVAITKSDDAITINENVQVITLATASATKTNTFAFYVGTGFLYASSSGSNELKTTANPGQNGDWYLEIKNTGVASITAQGDKTRKVMQFNLNNNNPAIFACYSSASQTSLAIYKKVCSIQPTKLATPTGLNVPNITSTSATLSWVEVENASSYTVFITDLDDEEITLTDIEEASVNVTGLSPETLYLWEVVAIGDGANYTDSEPSSQEDPNAEFTTSAAASPATITLSELGVTSTIDTYSVGDQYTLPNTSSQSCDGKQLVGWSTVEVAETDTKPTENYYELGAEVTLAATQTFYAVFAAGSGGGSTEATLTFDNTSKRTTLTTEQQVWTENNITLTNDKASSTSDIIDSSNPTRFYKNSQITVSAPENITKIVATTSGGDYTTALVNSVGGRVTSDGNTVTITPSASSNTYTIQLTGGQVRLNSITVTYGGGGYTAYTTSCIPTYSITYDFAGGTGSHCSNTSVPQGDPYTICDEAPTKEGHTFLGWSDGTNTYAAGATITPTKNTTLTAQWQINTYTVIWSNNGATTEESYEHGETLNVPDPNDIPSCDGVKEFVGWTEQSGYYHATTAPTDLFKTTTATVTADKTYYAVFATKGAGGTEFVLGESGTFKMYANVNGTNYYAQGGVSSSQITSTTNALSASDYTLTYADEVYTIKQGTSDIGHGSGTSLSSTSSTWTISEGTNGSWRVQSKNDESRALSYSSSANAFKAYATSNITAGDDTYFDIEFGTGSSGYSDYTTTCQQVESIEVQSPQTEFYLTDDFTIGTGKVIATLSGGGTTDVTALATFSGYNMNQVGTYTVTVTYMGATATYEINVKPLDNAWVLTWNVSGKTNTGLGPRYVTKGSAIGTLPTPEVPAACAGKTFMGWTESNVVPSDGKGIVYITEETVPSKNTTYYAVFATVNNFCTQKPIDQIGSGSKVVIVAVASLTDDGGAGKAISSRATDDTYNLQGDSVAIYDQTINTPHSTCIWTITESDGKYIFTQDGKYLNGIIDGNYSNLKCNNTSDSWSLSNAASGMAMTYNMKSTNASTEYVEWYNGKFTIHDEVNKNGDFDMQFFVTANADGNADITDYTTGCAEYTITYYGFHGGYSTSCSSDGTIVLPVNSIHTIPDCEGLVINDHTNLGREFLNVWMTQPHGGHTFKPGDTFILTQDTTLYAQWKMETTSDVTTLPTDIEDLAGTDIYVYGGTTLNIQPGTTTINSLTLKGGLQADGSYKMPTVWVPEGATLVRNSNKINLDLIVNAKTYYPFAVPFATKNDQYIDYLDPNLNAASIYDKHFVIKTYDGARRADVGEDKANNWVKVLRHTGGTTSYLEPGVGYIITALTRPDKDTATIRIPMTVPNTWFQNGEQAEVGTTVRNTIAVTAHAGAAATEHQRHAGWNFVANPYLTSFAGGNVANDGGLAYINGELIIQGSYEYGGDPVPYVTVPAYDFAYYSQHKLSDVKLSPEWSFFVQVGTGGTMNFTTAGRQQAPAHLAARAAEQPIKMDVDITLSDDNHSDQTGLIICDRFSDAYEIGHDLEKMFGSAYNLSVYTLMADNTPLAFQALAIQNSMQVIPVGYRTPAQGEYTFALNEATSDIELLNEQYEQLILVDYETGALTNMLNNEYTFYSDRTQSNNRFALYAVLRQNTTTDLPNTIGNEEVKKVIYNDHFYILRDGKVFNGAGQIVK